MNVVSVWGEFRDDDFSVRPFTLVSQHAGIDVGAPPLPPEELAWRSSSATRKTAQNAWLSCMASPNRGGKKETRVFDVRRSRAWVMTRRLTHTSHHGGQLMAMLRVLALAGRGDGRRRAPSIGRGRH